MPGNIYVLGGGTKLFAAIGVTYTPGITCTCAKGTKVLTAKNTSGQWVFAIPEEGTWKVVAGDRSQDVIITSEGQFESVNLAETVLWEAGAEYNTAITGGFETYEDSYVNIGNVITLTGNRTYFGTGSGMWTAGGVYYTKNKITTSAYKYFCIRVIKNLNASNNPSNAAWIYAANSGVFSDSDTLARVEIPVYPPEIGVFKVPLAGVGSAVLGVRVYGGNSLQTLEFDRLWLE